MSILEKLVANNESPILFIGSGMSKRYANNFPSWIELLCVLWQQAGKTEDEFYRKIVSIKRSYLDKGLDETVSDYNANIDIASEIEEIFDKGFSSGLINIPNFSARDSYENNISPFKKALSDIFSSIKMKESFDAEIQAFKKLLLSARAIFTTNYDTLLETLVEDEFIVYSKQSDLFLSQEASGELYKIHGCVTTPNEIIITKEDYNRFNNNSVLISAKLISMLMESPIIFLGYSLTDQNIAHIMRSFTESLSPNQRGRLQDRIIHIEYSRGQKEFVEYKKDSANVGSMLTVIETDNYTDLYEVLSKIDQGLPISYVRRFKDSIRQLIVSKGKQGALKSTLISAENLEDPNLDDDKLVVAIGNNTVIFNIPDRLDYLRDYVKDEPEIQLTVALKFIASIARNARVPYYKHLNGCNLDECGLRPEEIQKIQQRHSSVQDIGTMIRSIPPTYRIPHGTIKEICKRGEKQYKEIEIIASNINLLPLDDVENYIKDTLSKITYPQWKKCRSQLCRLALMWDIIKNKSN